MPRVSALKVGPTDSCPSLVPSVTKAVLGLATLTGMSAPLKANIPVTQLRAPTGFQKGTRFYDRISHAGPLRRAYERVVCGGFSQTPLCRAHVGTEPRACAPPLQPEGPGAPEHI